MPLLPCVLYFGLGYCRVSDLSSGQMQSLDVSSRYDLRRRSICDFANSSCEAATYPRRSARGMTNRRMGGAKRYPSIVRRVRSMGFALLYPSYWTARSLYALAPFARAAAFDSACRPVRAETEREAAKTLHGGRERCALPHEHRDLPFDGRLQQRQERQQIGRASCRERG